MEKYSKIQRISLHSIHFRKPFSQATQRTSKLNVSTDSRPNYLAPLTKQTTDLCDDKFLIELEVFKQLDKLHLTAFNSNRGFDQVPTWFLWLGTVVFAKPIANRWPDQSCHYSVAGQQCTHCSSTISALGYRFRHRKFGRSLKYFEEYCIHSEFQWMS